MKAPVGIIGVGLVGGAIAGHLLNAGYPVVGYDILETKRDALEALGGKCAGSPKEVADSAHRVFLSLMNTDIVSQVLKGPAGVLEASSKPRFIIDTTTGDPDETTTLAGELVSQNISYLDAPISGSSEQIRQKKAVVMIGGETDAFDACIDLFEAIADRFYHLGAAGTGAKAKLASNIILGLNRLALAEGFVFAEKLGLDLEAFLGLIKETPAYSCAMDVKGLKMIKDDFTPQSRILQHHKDLEIVLSYAERLGQELPLTEVHFDLLAQAIAAGNGDLDNAAVIKQIRNLASDRRSGNEQT